MIKSFSVENYKSFPNKVKIDFTANNYIKEKKESIVKIWKHSIVKNAIIYGQNAVWKTYLLKGIKSFSYFVLHNFSTVSDKFFYIFDLVSYWKNNDPISFEMEFLVWKKVYTLWFSIKNKKVVDEYLKENNKLIYEREKNKINLYKKLIKNKWEKEEKLELETALRPNSLLISLLGALNNEIALDILYFFSKIDFLSSLDYNPFYKNIIWFEENSPVFWYEIINKYKKLILYVLKIADFTIEDITIEVKKEFPDIKIYFKHKNWFILELSEESSGTKKFFDLMLFLLDVIENEKILLVDEFEDNLHYEIAKQIIKFINLSEWKSQFIFTTHNIEFMDFSLLRKDQIFLIDKNEKDEKEIYKVDDFKDVRKTYNVKELYKAWILWAYPIVEDFTEIKGLLDEMKR